MEYLSEVIKMSDRKPLKLKIKKKENSSDKKPLKLKIKKKESAPTTTIPEAQVSATEHTLQAQAQTGSVKLILKNAKIHIDQVIIRKK